MSQDIRIKKGLTIKLKGKAENKVSSSPRSGIFAIKPTDFYGIIPKLAIRVGDTVKAGDELFYSKHNDRIKFTSPVSGVIAEIKRGAKRKILAIEIKADTESNYVDFGIQNLSELDAEQIKSLLLNSGCWPFIQQRPYAIIANPDDQPKAIFISSFDTAPLAPDYAFALQGKEEAFQAGIDALAKLTKGKIHLGVDAANNTFFNSIKNVKIHKVTGKHPAGNVGVQISKINPINQGEKVWTVNPQDVAIIGNLFLTGKFEASRTIALVGSQVNKPQYYQITIGQNIEPLLKDKLIGSNNRIINGNVLTGEKVEFNGFLNFYYNLISIIPEGDHYDFLGWMPLSSNNKFSLSRTFFSWLTPDKEYVLDTNYNGEERAFVITGEMEQVMPLDIYPMQLLKATLAQDIEKMENLGIYEVIPEDFALIDFISTSKIEAQEIIRKGLDLMIQEVG